MASAETKIRATFVVLGVLCWYGTTLLTESTVVQLAVLVGIGLIAPNVVVEARDRR
ncbi:hypothetical protein [Haladaptatus sp. NG-WS-4]